MSALQKKTQIPHASPLPHPVSMPSRQVPLRPRVKVRWLRWLGGLGLLASGIYLVLCVVLGIASKLAILEAANSLMSWGVPMELTASNSSILRSSYTLEVASSQQRQPSKIVLDVEHFPHWSAKDGITIARFEGKGGFSQEITMDALKIYSQVPSLQLKAVVTMRRETRMKLMFSPLVSREVDESLALSLPKGFEVRGLFDADGKIAAIDATIPAFVVKHLTHIESLNLGATKFHIGKSKDKYGLTLNVLFSLKDLVVRAKNPSTPTINLSQATSKLTLSRLTPKAKSRLSGMLQGRWLDLESLNQLGEILTHGILVVGVNVDSQQGKLRLLGNMELTKPLANFEPPQILTATKGKLSLKIDRGIAALLSTDLREIIELLLNQGWLRTDNSFLRANLHWQDGTLKSGSHDQAKTLWPL